MATGRESESEAGGPLFDNQNISSFPFSLQARMGDFDWYGTCAAIHAVSPCGRVCVRARARVHGLRAIGAILGPRFFARDLSPECPA
jgi:hypothetical protein